MTKAVHFITLIKQITRLFIRTLFRITGKQFDIGGMRYK